METLITIGAFLGFLAFLKVGELSSKVNRLIRAEREQEDKAYTRNIHVRKDMLEPYIGNQIGLDFYEDEEDGDMFLENDAVLLAVDEKWALLEITTKNKKKQKLIRLSSLKGVSAKK
ncbi:MAG: hypothetical protein IKL22_03505 [Lachnospiraceae bacterium]|nr:hypothetical protein [Lachnospiraceae bacterium]